MIARTVAVHHDFRLQRTIGIGFLIHIDINDVASLSDDAGKAISAAAANYPPAAEIFMYDLSAGQSYTVSCAGMSAFTTVRVSNR